MKKIKRAIFAILMAAIAAPVFFPAQTARAAADPVSIEVKWIEKTYSSHTILGATSATFDIGGFGSAGYAVIGNTMVQNGVDGTNEGTTATVSTNTFNIVGFDWWAEVVGSSATLQIAYTEKTPVSAQIRVSTTAPQSFNSPAPMGYAFTLPKISTSSIIALPPSTPLSHTFKAQVSNPRFIFTNLTANATLYFFTDYGVPIH